jgi:formyltetrahydrofolate synthetase
LSNQNEGVLNSDPIDINGYVKQAPQATDSELEYLKQELQKQQNEVIINKQKEKGYKELQKTTEKLVDATEDYLEEKKRISRCN